MDDGNSKPLLVGECCSQNVLRRCTTRTEIKAHAPPSLESVFCKHVYSNGQRRAHALQRGLGVVSGWSRCGNPCPPQHPILDSQGAPLQALHGSQQLVPAGRSNGEDQQSVKRGQDKLLSNGASCAPAAPVAATRSCSPPCPSRCPAPPALPHRSLRYCPACAGCRREPG